jgi:hypothetical protein
MAEKTNTMKMVEVGVNKYGQRLDKFDEFGQSLEAEAWHFDSALDVSSELAPTLGCMNTKKPVEVGLNKYGQRLDEFNEFGQSLEVEAWHFDSALDVTVALVPALECMNQPAQKEKQEPPLMKYEPITFFSINAPEVAELNAWMGKSTGL